MLKLPAYQQLSKEQDAINNLPVDGRYVVIGPPGSGKSVMAIYRTAMLLKRYPRSLFLVYNQTLVQFLRQAMAAENVAGVAHTFHSWFFNWYRSTFRTQPPRTGSGLFAFDWLEVLKAINQRGAVPRYDHIVVDEGQDLPQECYTLLRLLTDNLTVFADENQRITEANSTITQIQHRVNPTGLHRLTRNYRNTREIAELAHAFYAGLKSGITELPTRSGRKPRATWQRTPQQELESLIRYEANNSDRRIAVFVQWNDQQRRIWRALNGRTTHRVQMYISSDQAHRAVDFGQPGITLLTYMSAKGLEFDTVFIPELHAPTFDLRGEHGRMQLYVLTSRAKDELYLSFSGDSLPAAIDFIPAGLVELGEPPVVRRSTA